MASNKKGQKVTVNPAMEEEPMEGIEYAVTENPEETDNVQEETPEPVKTVQVAPPAEAPPSTNLHQRLEALELEMLGKPAEMGWAVNRITILTGTLKTALPEAIRHIQDEGLREGLKTLLSIL